MCIRDSIYIGRLTRRRRLERILAAAALVRRQTESFRVVFMGHDASDGYYADTIGRLELGCLLYTSDAADERSSVDLGGRRIIKQKETPYIIVTS